MHEKAKNKIGKDRNVNKSRKHLKQLFIEEKYISLILFLFSFRYNIVIHRLFEIKYLNLKSLKFCTVQRNKEYLSGESVYYRCREM